MYHIMSVSEVEPAFSEYSAHDTVLASQEAQEWIEAVTGRTFSASFRECLEDGVLLCELMQKISPGSIRKISKSRSPIAHLDNIQQFLAACRELGMKDAQLFDCLALQKPQGAKASTWRTEADRRIRNVCITLYWLGRAVAEIGSYSGPQLDLAAFRSIMEHTHLSCSDEDSSLEQHSQADGENGFGLTFEQEQTADQLLADIQNAVDEMLQDFTSLVPQHSPPTTPHLPKGSGRLGVSVHMSGRDGSFGFQVVGGADTDCLCRVEMVLQGSAAEEAGLLPGDEIVSVNKQDITGRTHAELVRIIKKAGGEGSIVMGLVRALRPANLCPEKPQENGTENLPSNGHPAAPPSDPRPAPATPPPKPSRPFSDKQLDFQWQEENRERERQVREIALFQQPSSLGLQGMESSTPTGSNSPPLAEQPDRLLEPHPPPATARQPDIVLEPLPLPEAADLPRDTLEPLPSEPEQSKIPPKFLPPPAVEELMEPLPPPTVEDTDALLEPHPLPVIETAPHSAEDLLEASRPVIPFERPRQVAEGSYSSQSSRSASPSDSSCSEYDPQPYTSTSVTPVVMEITREPLNVPVVLPEEPTAAEVMLKPITEEQFSEETASTSPESGSDEFQPSEEGTSRPISKQTVSTYTFKQEPVHTYVTEQPLPERYSEPIREQPPAARKVPLEETIEEEEPTFEESSLASMTQPIVMQMPGPVELHGELKISKVHQTHWTPQGKHWTQSQWEPQSPTHSPYQQWSLESPPGPQPQQQATRHHASPPTLQNGQAQQQAPPPTRKRSEPHPPSMPMHPPAVRSYTWSSKDRPKDGPQQAYAIRASNSYEPCSRCRKPLGRGQVMSLPLAYLQFHLHCFTCHVCHSALTRGAQNTSVLIHSSLPHCQYCFSNERGIMTTEC